MPIGGQKNRAELERSLRIRAIQYWSKDFWVERSVCNSWEEGSVSFWPCGSHVLGCLWMRKEQVRPEGMGRLREREVRLQRKWMRVGAGKEDEDGALLSAN